MKLTQQKFAEIIGCDQSDISKFTKSDKIGDSYLWRIVCKFPINPKWLENGTEPMIIDYESLKNDYKDNNNELVETQRELISVLKERVCELKNQLQESKHALKNTVTAD